ncbi:MAG: holdfast anchor protein HfaD [Robiginitomaculum sp.]|nr:holdfast anchor protein HfaD [Robiginitomaculum sp.]MDQ7076800.1 holdfast anchor protein HfaD [Robiginitomaculum sp.]
MRLLAKILLAGTTAATGLCGAAYAGDTTEVINVQLDNDPFTAGLNVVSVDVLSVLGAATALGNTLSVQVDTGNLTLNNTQTLNGAGSAQSVIRVNSASEELDSIATTFGNSATITTCCGTIDAVSQQTVGADATQSATSDVTADNWAFNPTSTATAVANAISYETWDGGRITAWAGQTNNASVVSDASLNAGLLADSATITATSIGNSATAGGESTTLDVDANQRNFGTSISARAQVNSPDGEDVISTAAATGNAYNVENAYGFAKVVTDQNNSAQIEARSDVTLDLWQGWNASTAYAVANSNLVSNIGSDIDLANIQNNDGGVEATATFTGGTAGGGVGNDTIITDFVTSATAFGNAVSGFVCSTCGGGITANNRQTNAGTIVASSSVNTGSGGALIATATAVGNSATFHTVEAGN